MALVQLKVAYILALVQMTERTFCPNFIARKLMETSSNSFRASANLSVLDSSSFPPSQAAFCLRGLLFKLEFSLCDCCTKRRVRRMENFEELSLARILKGGVIYFQF